MEAAEKGEKVLSLTPNHVKVYEETEGVRRKIESNIDALNVKKLEGGAGRND